MGQKKKLGKTRLDKFYHLAKEQGYRSRAAFKLIQLNRKYDFLSSARSCLDLCAAPGGWLQVAAKTMPIGSLILGVDLVPIRPVRGARTYIGDITTAETRALLKRESNGALFDVVLHDGAPNVGGAWASEAYSQAALALESLRLATDTLAPGGTFVTKVFRSKDYTPLMYALKQLFKNVEATKPAASRSTSAEIFVVCQKYKAPSKIDPRLLDPKHLFQEVSDAPRVGGPDALLKQKQAQRRFREGYEDGVSTLHKALPAATFVLQDRAIEALGAYTALDLGAPAGEPEAEAFVREHPATSAEVRALCADLQVLGRSEFKQLLKWRLTVRKDWLKSRGKDKAGEAAAAEEESQPKEEEEEEDAEAALLREMEEIQSKMERAAKRERKKRRELRGKARLRAAQLAASEGIVNEDGELGLFNLPGVRGDADDVERLTRAAVPDESDFESEDEAAASDASSSSEEEGRDEAERYSRELDRALDRSYDAWRQGRAIKTREGGEIVKKRRRRVGMDGDLDSEEEEGEDEALERFDGAEARGAVGGGLVVGLDERLAGVARTPAAAAAQWFGQDFFEDPDVAEDAEEEEEETLAAPEPSDAGRADDADELVESDESEDEGPAPAAVAGAPPSSAPARRGADFEVVPAQASSDSESDEDDELELLDDEAKATMMAIAKKMLRRKVKDDIVEAAYSRYAFHDSDVPRWFEEEERRFMRPIAPVSAEEVREAREALRAVSARPMRKVAEAKARKAKRLNERLSKARQKAEAIAASEDGSASAKVREIERLYKDARGRGRGKKKPSRSDQYKKKGPHLDKRMKKDKRGMERAAAKKKGGKRR